jgi:hypothetical protein
VDKKILAFIGIGWFPPARARQSFNIRTQGGAAGQTAVNAACHH